MAGSEIKMIKITEFVKCALQELMKKQKKENENVK